MRQKCNRSVKLQDGNLYSSCFNIFKMEDQPQPPSTFSMNIFYTLLGTYLLLFLSSPLIGEIPKASTLFKEWIATERLISKESSNWEIEKSALQDLLELLEEEKQTIEEKLNSVEKENSAGEGERIKLADQNEDLKSAILPVSETLEKLEAQILGLAPRFPPPLMDDLQSFINRIPKKDQRQTVAPSVSQRLQAVVGALAKIDKFNSSIAMDEKLLKVDSGEIKVSVLYFGLGIAYFTDETGSKAGYLLPSDSGWEEFDESGAGTAILEAISFYNRTAQKQASFVDLPFKTN